MVTISKTQLKKNDWRLSIVGIMLIAFFVIIDFIVFSGWLQSSDVTLFYSINSFHTTLLDYVMVFLSNYGRELFWGCTIILLWFLGERKDKLTALILLFTFLSLAVTGELLKLLEFRPRPFETLQNVRLLIHPSVDSSFPSGHALTVFAGATIAWLRLKRGYSILLMIESFLVAYSRVYVGVHYPSDVMSGSILGVAGACLTLAQLDKATMLYNSLRRIWRQNF